MTENEIQRQILAYLRKRPDVWCCRMQSGRVKSRGGGWLQLAPGGTADILGMRQGGHAFAIEVKTKEGKPTEAQIRWADWWQRLGGAYCVARSVADVEALLREGKAPHEIQADAPRQDGAPTQKPRSP